MCGQDKLCRDEVQWMPVWSCLDNLARLQMKDPQSHLNIETPKPPSVSLSWLSGNDRRSLRLLQTVTFPEQWTTLNSFTIQISIWFKILTCNVFSHVYFCSVPALSFSCKAIAPPELCHPHSSDTILCINKTKGVTHTHTYKYTRTYNGWKIL